MNADTLDFIRGCVLHGHILWTYHANMRLRVRAVRREQVTQSTASYRLIEYHAQSTASRYLPSALIYAIHEGAVFHILFALDVPNISLRVVTMYRPDPELWEDDLIRRRRQ